MATSRLFILLRPSILRNSGNFSQTPVPKFNIICRPRFKRYSTSSLTLDSDASSTVDPPPSLSAHPWPEWVNFIDRLKAKGYITQDAENGGAAEDGAAVVYTDVKSVKDASLSFARQRFDIFKSLSTHDLQTIVVNGCPKLLRKAINSAKRLRAYVGLDEGDVCSSCNLRGSCDRAYVILNESEAAARTVDVVRILLLYALDPLVISGESKPSDRKLVESSARKLLLELVELGERPADPDLPRPAFVTPQRKKQPLDLSDNTSSKDVDMKPGDWVCTRCKFMNFSRNVTCLRCKGEGPSERPNSVSTGGVEMKMGDWNCPECSFMNFSSKRQCLRCHTPRPPRQLRLGDWECPDCDFWNYRGKTVCKKCNRDRPPLQISQQHWEKPY